MFSAGKRGTTSGRGRGGEFYNDDHLLLLREESLEGKKTLDDVNKATLKVLVQEFHITKEFIILQAKNTGACLSVHSTTVSGIVLSYIEFWDFLCIHYNVTPLNLQIHCDGCGTAFEVTHTNTCNNGGLVIACHNKVCDKLLYLAQRSFTPASVRAEPLIHQGRTRSKREICQGSDKDKETGGGDDTRLMV